jgi:hypothetical protein
MKHRVAQILLIIAGIGMLVTPFLTFKPVHRIAFPQPALSLVIQILIAGACFVGAIIAGRNARRHKP